MRWIVLAYRSSFGRLGVARCRFLPSCSQYALDALEQTEWWWALWLIMNRLARCHPLGGSGFDPVVVGEGHKRTRKSRDE